MSRQGVSPEEMMSVAKTMAKGEGLQGASDAPSNQNNSQQSGSSGQQTGYEDASGQQGGYSNIANQQESVNTMSSQQGPMGLQAQGAGLGQGFDQGFGQGLSGDPNGSEPHDGIQVQEEVAPDSGSRDTDLHTTGNASGGGYETHQHHHDSFATKSYIQGS